MYDFLSFNTFITQKVLVVFYYIGAVGIPLLLFFYRKTLMSKLSFLEQLRRSDKIIALVSLLIMFLFMELFWRMMFEAMIGYFDMHDYLQHLSKGA